MKRTNRLTLLFLGPFLIILVTFLVYVVVREDKMAEEAHMSELRERAAALYEIIAIARLWNAEHGGVYAKITEKTRPNPYLDIKDRDIVSITGERYTKINPAYMTRQFSELAAERNGNKFRLLSLRPLNPANAAGPLEARSLAEMARTGSPAAIIDEPGNNENRKFRYLVPLRIEASCLDCHRKQGYRTGDVKGGLEIMLPMQKYGTLRSTTLRRIIVTLSSIGIVSMILTAVVTWLLARRLSRAINKNIEREKLDTAMELAGATAHEMRQPMTVVQSMIYLMKDTLQKQGAVSEQDLDLIHTSCSRMNDIIERLLRITDYKAKPYVSGLRIMDIEQSTTRPDDSDRPEKNSPTTGR